MIKQLTNTEALKLLGESFEVKKTKLNEDKLEDTEKEIIHDFDKTKNSVKTIVDRPDRGNTIRALDDEKINYDINDKGTLTVKHDDLPKVTNIKAKYEGSPRQKAIIAALEAENIPWRINENGKIAVKSQFVDKAKEIIFNIDESCNEACEKEACKDDKCEEACKKEECEKQEDKKELTEAKKDVYDKVINKLCAKYGDENVGSSPTSDDGIRVLFNKKGATAAAAKAIAKQYNLNTKNINNGIIILMK